MRQRCHAHPVEHCGRFRWIIERHHCVIVAAVAFGPILRALVRIKRPDVPRADTEDVGHARDASAIIALQSQSNSVIP